MAVESARLTRHVSGRKGLGWWGMALFATTEAVLFATLLTSYFYIRFQAGPEWPPDGISPPELGLPLAMTVVLLSSSIPMHIADSGIRRGSQGRLKAGLAFSFLLGATFIGMQAYEYSIKLEVLTPQTNAYGSLFFTITSFHGLHVVGGLLISGWTQLRAWSGHFDAENHLAVQNTAFYWHFVDIVWILILLSLYISPRL